MLHGRARQIKDIVQLLSERDEPSVMPVEKDAGAGTAPDARESRAKDASPKDRKAERLAAALRENLRRRKAQGRERSVRAANEDDAAS